MSKAREIWEIIRRKDFKEGDEVHAAKFDGGLMVSDALYGKLKPKIEAMPDTKYLGDLYSVRIISTPYLPYIYHEVDKSAPPTAQPDNTKEGEK